LGGDAARLAVETHDGFLRVTSSGSGHDVAVGKAGPDRWSVTVDGVNTAADAICDAEGGWLRHGGFEGRIGIALAVVAAAAERGASGETGDTLRASMPGTVVSLHVAEGDSVEAGQIVAVLESMKLFMELKSPASGTVRRLGIRAGATVAAGDMLIAVQST
jgi:acetyl/propionyl-CoA carboxylase alpha subunit